MLEVAASFAFGYLLGAIPMAALVARLRGRTIFEVGSGNMGAMNTARNLGYGLGALVLALDIGKGALATYGAMLMASASGQTGPLALGMPLAAGVGAVVGHAWSVFVKFRGGKALATTLGVSLPLYPLGGLYGLGLLVALLLMLRRATPAALITIVCYPLVVALTLSNLGWPRNAVFAVFTGLIPIVAVVVVKHLVALRHDRAAAAGRAAPVDAASSGPRSGSE